MGDTPVLRIGLVQSDIIWEDVEANLLRYSGKLDALAGKTDIIVLPEMFATGFSMNSEQIAQPQNGHIAKWLQDEAERCKCAIVAGAAIEEIINGQKYYFNRLLWTESNRTQKWYDKRHLFGMAGENQHYTSGNNQVIINYLGWRIRPFVCYDLRFPVWCRNVAPQASDPDFMYDCALYIANWPASRSLQWSMLLRARAIENQCFTIGVNRVGTDIKGYAYSGDSAAISYQGTDIISMVSYAEQVETVMIDKRDQDTYRRKFPFIKDADSFNIQ